MAFNKLILKILVNVDRYYVEISYTECHPYQSTTAKISDGIHLYL